MLKMENSVNRQQKIVEPIKKLIFFRSKLLKPVEVKMGKRVK